MGKTVVIDVRSKRVKSKYVLNSYSMSKGKGSKQKSKSKSRKYGKDDGVFSGKILGYEVPGLSGVIRNKTYQKVAAGAGTVAIAVSIAQFLNNKKINDYMKKKEVKVGLAIVGGDIIGGGFELLKDGGIKSLGIGNNSVQSQQNTMSLFDQPGMA